MVVVNHTYKEIGMFPKDIVGGGTGSYYSADNIFILGRQQEKEGTEIIGYNFIINVEKSRYTKEKSKIPIAVTFDGGISKYSGLVDIGIDGGFISKPSPGWYAKVDQETGEVGDKVRFDATQTDEFMLPLLKSEKFKEFVNQKYGIAYGNIMGETPILEEENDEVQ